MLISLLYTSRGTSCLNADIKIFTDSFKPAIIPYTLANELFCAHILAATDLKKYTILYLQ